MKKKVYNVIWEEELSVNVEAENEEEAVEMIHECNYDENGVASEITLPPRAYHLTDTE